MAFWKDSMINRLSNLINRNRSAAKILQVLCFSFESQIECFVSKIGRFGSWIEVFSHPGWQNGTTCGTQLFLLNRVLHLYFTALTQNHFYSFYQLSTALATFRSYQTIPLIGSFLIWISIYHNPRAKRLLILKLINRWPWNCGSCCIYTTNESPKATELSWVID